MPAKKKNPPEREKVLKALKHCITIMTVGCKGCPYYRQTGERRCFNVLYEDAVELLKKEES